MIRRIRDGLEYFRRYFIRQIYRGRVRYAIKRIGLDVVLRKSYYYIITQFDRQLSNEHSKSTYRVKMNNVDVTFRTTTPRERDVLSDSMAEGDSEEEVLRDMFEEFQKGDVFFDIGAHIGLYSCLVGAKFPEGQVVSFEPHPKTYQRLQQNLSDNNINAVVKPFAISDEDGETNFDVRRNTSGGMGVMRKTGNHTVRARSLDSLVKDNEIPTPTVIKSDIAGEEINLVRGGSEVLSNDKVRLIYLEMHPANIEQRGGSESEIQQLLTEYGFANFKRFGKDDGSAYHLKAKK